MDFNILDTTETWLIVSILFLVMIIFLYAGNISAKRRHVKKSESSSNGALIAGIYSLIALILAFTFSMAGNRFDSRKIIIVEEANDIGTAVLRADMYPDSIRTFFREDFKNYLEARIAYYEAHDNLQKVNESFQSASIYSDKLWARATKLSMNNEYFVASAQMIPALNSMFDIANSRLHGELYKIPDAIILLLMILLIIASFIFGYTTGKIDWYIGICFCIVTALTMYFLLDLDRPRRGLINLDDSNKAIIELRKMF